MMPADRAPIPTGAVFLPLAEGRRYQLGAMQAVFKADGEETGDRYSVSEWWLDPHSAGPGAHSHEANDELFFVMEGDASFLVDDRWVDAPRGSFVLVPAGMPHDFANRTSHRVGILNVFTGGGFERNMPAIVRWYEEQR